MKHIKWLLIFVIVMMLSGCQINIDTNFSFRPTAYEADADHINYLAHDIVALEDFIDVVNGITYDVMPSMVIITLTIQDEITQAMIDQIIVVGIVFDTFEDKSYVLTSSDVIDTTDATTQTLDVMNYKGDTRAGGVVFHDAKSGLAIIEIISFTEVELANFASRQSLSGEPIIMIGRQDDIRYAMTMGLYVISELDVFESSIDTNLFHAGGLFINLSGDVIGIITSYSDENSAWQIANHLDIESFIQTYQNLEPTA